MWGTHPDPEGLALRLEDAIRERDEARAWARQLARMRANPMTGDLQLLREFAAFEWAREG
jgi:hypothetical protein